MGPFRIAKEHIKTSDPRVKERANFCGRKAMRGKPTPKAKPKKTADRNRSAQNTCRRVV
jgi:hypothetical protein